jgi:hypothetical protein
LTKEPYLASGAGSRQAVFDAGGYYQQKPEWICFRGKAKSIGRDFIFIPF